MFRARAQAVIDEIQMMASEDRGYAWTRALLGAPASEVHCCGEEAAVELVRALAALCGDELEVRRYKVRAAAPSAPPARRCRC